ncbi:MAG: DUF3105 domain-containing protein [Dehalococcoidia bacterium]
MTRLLVGLAVALLVPLVIACSGGGKDSSEADGGAKDPQTAVRNLLDAVMKQDENAIEAAINPIYADNPSEIGVGDLITLRAQTSAELKDLKLNAEYDSERKNARVFVNGKIVTKDGEANLDNKVLLTSIEGDRWYVTSPYSEYWSALLRPAPAAWVQVQADSSPTLPGTYVPPHPGADGVLLQGSDDRAHVANDLPIPLCTPEQIAANNWSSPLCYPSNPPTSGPHAASAAPFRVFSQPVGKEYLVHSMEHGGVVIWYNSNDPSVIQKLAALTEANIQRGKEVVLAPYPGMEANTVAITAWTRLDKFPAAQLDVDRLQNFINVHERRFNPEGF